MLRGRDIICISSIDWDFIWQGHQQIMTTLVAHGNRVLFVENTGVRAPRVADLTRLQSRLRNWWRGTKGFREERGNLFVYSPVILPFPYSSAARTINRAILTRALRRWMKSTDFQRPIVWTFLPTPLALALTRDMDAELTVYYCIDDLASSSPQARRITASEQDLFREADLVFVTSEKLRGRAAQFRRRVDLFPFGVNFKEFERVREEPEQPMADLQDVPRPIAGYVGGLHQWVDQDLLVSVAQQLPDVSFVLVGPAQCDVSRLAACPNMHVLGARPHGELPRYIKRFDVGLIPYRLSEYTANVYPTKLNEYLAMGKPVVATDLPEIRRVNSAHSNIVQIGNGAHAFADAVRSAVADGADSERLRRIDVARENGWDARVEQMSRLIEEAIAERKLAGHKRWEQTLRRLYRRARRRIAATAAVLALLLGLLFYTPVVWTIAGPLRVSEPPQPAQAIVVFAGGVGESGQAGGGYQERVKRAVDLYQQGYARQMIFSSGFAFVFKEAEVMRDLAISQGVPASAIVLETKAANTFQNVANVKGILDDQGWTQILLVSSPYHMRRALLTWHKTAPGVSVVAVPVPASQFYAHERAASLDQILGIAHEYAAIVAYWFRGWI